MSFQEVHVSQFTSATTPFTACRHKDGFFATETHSLHCTFENDNVTVSAGPLPSSREHCVGHDQSGAWHLFAFLDSDDEQVMMNVSSAEAATLANHNPKVPHSSLESSMRSMEASLSSLSDAQPPTAEAHDDDDDDDTTIAWLVLRSREEIAPTFTAPLAFRPLSPLLTCPMSHYSEDEARVVAWVGSADDSLLRCYIPQDGNGAILKQVKLNNEHFFSLDSPVMVMDSLEGKNQQHWIAVGCQDGTVRVISFRFTRTGDSLDFSKLEAHTVLVDGPIIALHLSQEKDDSTIHLIVGSMCGFACGLEMTQGEWQGPWMIAEGLWNSILDSEDAILAVNRLSNSMVAVGTHSGLCCVYQQRKGDDKSYQLLWKVQLPYSIHGLSHVNVSSSGQPSLLVTTRYTFHVFQRHVPKYSADMGKRRVEKLILQRQDATELLNLA